MLYREIIAVCSQIHTKHINTLCGQNVELYIKTQPYRAVNTFSCDTYTRHTLCGQNVEYLSVKPVLYKKSLGLVGYTITENCHLLVCYKQSSCSVKDPPLMLSGGNFSFTEGMRVVSSSFCRRCTVFTLSKLTNSNVCPIYYSFCHFLTANNYVTESPS